MNSTDAFAHWLGANALAAFAVGLALVLLAVAAAWWGFQRTQSRAAAHPAAPRRRGRLLWLAIAGVVACAGGLVLAEMSDLLNLREAMARFDAALAASLREHVSPAVLQGFALLTTPGDSATRTVLCIGVALLLAWRGQHSLAAVWVLALAGGGTINTLLKNLFERSRPQHLHGLDVGAHGWSFPSGHSSGAVVAYGMLAYLLLRFVDRRWQLPVLLAATAVAFTTGSSRVFLQVHYASDVLAGFTWGLAWLALCVLGCEWLQLRSGGPAAARAGA